MARWRPLSVGVIVLALVSIALTLTLRDPASHLGRLLAAQVVGVGALLLLGVDLLRRPRLRTIGWVVLGLGVMTAALLVQIAARLDWRH
ncbi:MAG: hypothetical protein E6K82_03775 [Candidatus Rokuibacteriota bacterium]|nr:MAG: hypothetical protein E6K82_03775 [Candidatus Rokubacteria bacterium]